MPNWVYNSLSISGTNENLSKFLKKAKTPRPEGINSETKELEYSTDEFSFWNFIAPPQEAIESGEYFGTHGYTKEEGKVGHTPNNWYEFNNREWGTKWDACDQSVEELSETSTSVSITFQTAWSPPEPVFEAMVEQHPELDFSIHWEEEQGFGAELESTTTEEGKSLVVVKSWDIPASHSDYAERDDLDGCRCAWEENPHEWYPDCENKEIELQQWHKENSAEQCECSISEPDIVY